MSYREDKIFLAQNLRRMQRVGNLATKNTKILRGLAHDSARCVNKLLHGTDLNDLMVDIRVMFPGDKGCVDRWLDMAFAPYVELGGDYREALRAVEQGVTRKQFVALDFFLHIHGTTPKRPAKPRVVVPEAPIPASIPDTIPDGPLPRREAAEVIKTAKAWESRAVFVDTRLTTVTDQLKAARARIRDLERENAELKSRLRRLDSSYVDVR